MVGITFTITVSTEGIQDITVEEMDKMFQDAGYYKQRARDKSSACR